MSKIKKFFKFILTLLLTILFKIGELLALIVGVIVICLIVVGIFIGAGWIFKQIFNSHSLSDATEAVSILFVAIVYIVGIGYIIYEVWMNNWNKAKGIINNWIK